MNVVIASCGVRFPHFVSAGLVSKIVKRGQREPTSTIAMPRDLSLVTGWTQQEPSHSEARPGTGLSTPSIR
eukprot:1854736-Prorocentrum_lima.AAC.1